MHHGKLRSYHFLELLSWILSIQSGDIPASAAAMIKLACSLGVMKGECVLKFGIDQIPFVDGCSFWSARFSVPYSSLLVSVILGCNSYCSVWKTANYMGGGGPMKQVKHSIAFLVRAGSTNQKGPVRDFRVSKTWPLSFFVNPSFLLVHVPIKKTIWCFILFNFCIKWNAHVMPTSVKNRL